MHRIFQPSIKDECNYYTKQDLDTKFANVYKQFDDMSKTVKTQADPQMPTETKLWFEKFYNDTQGKLSGVSNTLSEHLKELETLKKEHQALKEEHLAFKSHTEEFIVAILNFLKIEYREEDNEQPSQKTRTEAGTVNKQPPPPPERNHFKAPPAEEESIVKPKQHEHPVGSIARMMSMGLVK